MNNNIIKKFTMSRRFIYFLFLASVILPAKFSYAVSFMGKTSAKFSYVRSNVGSVNSTDIKSSVSNLSFDLNLVFNNGIFIGLSGDKDHLFQRSLDGFGDEIRELTSTLGFGVNVGYWNSGFYASLTYLPVVSGKTLSDVSIAEAAGIVGQAGLAINLAGVIPGIDSWPYVGLGPSFRYKMIVNQSFKTSSSSNDKNNKTSGLSLMLDLVLVF